MESFPEVTFTESTTSIESSEMRTRAESDVARFNWGDYTCLSYAWGMKAWIDTFCIDQTDAIDRGAHVLRVKDILGRAFTLTVWTKEDEDLHVLGLSSPGERLLICKAVLNQYGKQVLEELIGVKKRQWGVADEEDNQIMTLVQDLDELVFHYHHHPDSDDEDNFGFGSLHLRDSVYVELMQMFQKEYWS